MARPVLLIDTREQKPLDFSLYKERFSHIVKMKLEAGDYSILGHEDTISFERKSLGDLVSTLTQGKDRFLRELEKLKDYRYAAIVVEASYGAIVNPANNRYTFSRANPRSIVGMLQAIQLRYNIDIIYSGSRRNSEELIVSRIEALLG